MDVNNCSNNSNISMSVEEYLEYLQRRSYYTELPTVVMLIVFLVIGLVGNSFVLIIYYHSISANPTKVLIMTMSGFNLMTGTFAIPVCLYFMFHNWTFKYPALCKAGTFLVGFPVCGETMTLLFIAMTRYRKVCHPYKWQVTTRQAYQASAAITIIAFVYIFPVTIFTGIRSKPTPCPKINGTECYVNNKYYGSIWPVLYNLSNAAMIVCMSIAMVVFYFCIGVAAYKHRGKISIARNTITYVASVHEQVKMIRAGETPDVSGKTLPLARTSLSVQSTSNLRVNGKSENAQNPEKCHAWFENKDDADNRRSSIFTNTTATTTTTTKTDDADEKQHNPDANILAADTGIFSGFRYLGAVCAHRHSTAYLPNKRTLSRPASDARMSFRRYSVLLKEMLRDMDSVASSTDVDDNNKPTVEQKAVQYQSKNPIPLLKSSLKRQERRRPMGRLTAMLIIITLVFIIGFIPFLILNYFKHKMPERYNRLTDFELVIFSIFYRLYLLNSAVNPIIYGLCDRNFRHECIHFLTCTQKRLS